MKKTYMNRTTKSMVTQVRYDKPKTGNHAQHEMKPKFGEFCMYLLDNIRQQRPIYDDMLLNFNKMVVYLIENNIGSGILHFDELSYCICEYIRYGLANDSNKQRVYSYIRLSQMIDTLKLFQEERKIEVEAHREASVHPEYARIIREIGRGIYKLTPKTSKSDKDSLLDLITKDFVFESGIENDRYYMLSKTGDALFRIMYFDGDYDWVDQWNNERIVVFLQCLLSLRESNPNVVVKDVVTMISKASEKEIYDLYGIIKQNPNLNRKLDSLLGHKRESSYKNFSNTNDSMFEMISYREAY